MSKKHPNIDSKQLLIDVYRPNKYKLDDRFVLNDGKKHKVAVVCPGGGYTMVCSFLEGKPIARKLNELGYSVFIVYYRVRKKAFFNAPQDDLALAIRTIFEKKDQYNIEPEDYMLWGFSAGGHLASSFATKTLGYEKYNLPKPKTLVLGYPVTSMFKDISHKSTHDYHVGKNPTREIEEEHTSYLHVDKDYPKTFICTGTDDKLVKIENTKLLENALNEAHVINKVIWNEGLGHGFGVGLKTIAEGWIDKAIKFHETGE